MTAVHADVPIVDLAAQPAEVARNLDSACAGVATTSGGAGGVLTGLVLAVVALTLLLRRRLERAPLDQLT